MDEPPLDVDELRAHIDQKMIDLREYVVFESHEGLALVNPSDGTTITMVPAPDWDLPKVSDVTVYPEQPRSGGGQVPDA